MPEANCPHCSGTLSDLWDYSWTYEEDEQVEAECGHCEKPIIIKRRVRTTYEVLAPEVTP